jgi:DNA uptake protein ComE-like DNA-binding protein
LSTALIGSVIGIFRHNWLKTPEILLSPQNLPSYINVINEGTIITSHNAKIKVQLQKSNIEEIIEENVLVNTDDNISLKIVQETLTDSNNNKIESGKKKIIQNTSGIININIASKEDFMKLSYIGEVKAERIVDLERVKGIGPKIFTKIEPFITI